MKQSIKQSIRFSIASVLLSLAGALVLTGCGGGDSAPLTLGGGSGSGGSSAPPPPPAPTTGAPSLVITLTNPTTGAATTSVPATVRAYVRDDLGAAVPNTVVTFTTDTSLGALVPSSGTALTDSSGVATVALNAASLMAAGAATLTAVSQVASSAVTDSIGYSVGAAAVTISNFTFGTNPLSAFGTTSVSVTVNSNGVPVTSPQTVTFSSPCAGSGKAALTASVLTGTGGIATASYLDIGCGGTDVVTASVSGLATASSTLTVAAPTTGSIRFVSATPTTITLKGTGGAGRQESSQVIFQVVDTGGNAIGGKTVDFSLSTSIGGITFANGLTTSSAVSDATTGYAVVTVNSGTISTPVRVLASTVSGTTTLTTQSDQLTITTGIPDQDSFSLSATTLNVEGLNFDGETTVLTARLSDHFNNPVPNQTAVNFIAEGASVVGSCSTSNGACTVTLTSQEPRPADGRVTVLAYAVGEESFTDYDGDGYADLNELFDANGVATDLGEAFVDYNENGIRDANEPFLNFGGTAGFDGPDGKYNGVLCNETAPGTSSTGTCATAKSVHVRRSTVITLSGSTAAITVSPTPIDLLGCGPVQTVSIYVRDVNNNPMPAGTTVVVTTTNGTLQGTVSFVQANTSSLQLAPNYSVLIKGDGTGTPAACTDTTLSGTLTVTVRTPKGITTISNIPVNN